MFEKKQKQNFGLQLNKLKLNKPFEFTLVHFQINMQHFELVKLFIYETTITV